MSSVAILDYGSGNLRSAERALARAGAEVAVTADPYTALHADGLVVPGVGAFAACAEALQRIGGGKLIGKRLAGARPVLGICVGMQILFERGIEHGVEAAGLGEWPGTVDALPADILPHMGWNTVRPAAGSELFAGLAGERFYFVHSYAARSWQLDAGLPGGKPMVSWAHHGGDFVAAVENGPLRATQFHPEKSGEAGIALLRNWLATL